MAEERKRRKDGRKERRKEGKKANKAKGCLWAGVADSWRGPYREWKAEPATHPENEDPASNQALSKLALIL